ncbi:MAG TPA: Spy/CpxP family protein refolding chaperone [Alphaproteobacteria bacterium]|nr:Spy/CpxP family protein refolding chaperone [Alphaproteobacteria bacterium]
MSRLTLSAARAALAAGLLGSVAFAGLAPASAAEVLAQTTQDQTQSGTTAPAPSQTAPATPHKGMRHARLSPTDRVENRIKELHSRLKITPEQETQWSAVAQVMRDNAKQVEDLLKQRRANIQSMTALDDLRSYQAIAQAHADGLQKLTTAFQTLYDGMSDTQKKNADAVFSSFEGRHHGHHHGAAKKPAAPQQQ